MKLSNIASSASLGLFVLAVPLLTGANSNGCSGGNVVVDGDGGSSGTTGGGDACNADADCTAIPEVCLVCADGSCALPGCYAGSCGLQCAPPADPSCGANTEFLEITGDGADQTFSFANCPPDQPPSGAVEAFLVHHGSMPTGLAIRSCSGQGAWLTLYGASGDTLPGQLGDAMTDYVNASGSDFGAKHTDVNITYFGQVGQVVEGTFSSQLEVGPEQPILLFGEFRACRVPNHQDP